MANTTTPVRGSVPNAYIIDDVQRDYIDTSTDKYFSSIDDKYYLCFSQKSLDNINSVAQQIITYDLPEN